MASYDVVTLEQAKQVIPVDGETGNEKLARLISAVTLELEARLQTAFVQRSFVMYREGRVKAFYPDRAPLASITSIVDPASNAVPATEFLIRRQRWIEHMGIFPIAYATTGQPTDWTITYTAGWFATQALVTPDVRSEVISCLSTLFTTVGSNVAGPVVSTSVGDLSVSYANASSASEGNTIAGNPAIASCVDALYQYRGGYL